MVPYGCRYRGLLTSFGHLNLWIRVRRSSEGIFLDCGTYNGTYDMERDEEGWGRGGDIIYFQQPVDDGGALFLGNASGA